MSQEVELTPIETNKAEETNQNGMETGLADKPGVEGTDNPAFSQETQELESMEVPPMTFVDFMPRLLEEAASNADAPCYSDFR